jgi:regulation of enolase protein 1 (concanavalin A-like superfamily)
LGFDLGPQGETMNKQIILSLTLITLLGACAPAQPPAARALSEGERQLAEAADLTPLNTDFAEDSLGKLTWLDPEGQEHSQKDSWLTLRNTNRSPVWYSDTSGAMLHTQVSGDFMVETKVTSNLRSDTSKRSDSRYTSAGLVVRDPASTSGKMRWMVFNVGNQDGFFGTEIKTTRDAPAGFSLDALTGNSSSSTWFSNKIEGSSNEAKLRICRVGPELRFLILPTGQTTWREETLTSSSVRAGVEGEIPGVSTNGPMRFQRADLPAMLQVGLMSNDIGNAATGEGRYDYIRFNRINSFDACTQQ